MKFFLQTLLGSEHRAVWMDPGVQLTVDQFMQVLEKLRHHFDWDFERHWQVGVEQRAWPRFQLRARDKTGCVQDVTLNVVEAEGYAVTGKLEPWQEAAKAIKLSATDAGKLIAASNHQTWREIGRRRRPDRHLQALRVKLLEIVDP